MIGRIALVLGAVVALAAPVSSAKPERRCGWFVNVTPGNFELDDREGEWTLAEQGGYEAPGLDNLPDMATKGWVETNGHHGHGCACMTVITDRSAMLVEKVIAATPIPLARCKADRKLPKP